ncbi:MAG: NAD(P)H-binding protein [Pseudomonadota bacterium]|nr:NAD(P)H-binding protein [Pseudomonadota bacterium]
MLLVLGATGDTGARIVGEARRRKLPLLLAARDVARLQLLAQQQGVDESAVRVTDLSSQDGLGRALEGVTAVINAVSPAWVYAQRLADAVARAGIAYTDISGDVGTTNQLIQSLGRLARSNGATLVPGAGFSPYCGLTALRLALERLPNATHAQIIYSTPSVRPTSGTLASEPASLLGPSYELRNGQLVDCNRMGRLRKLEDGGWGLTRPMLDPVIVAHFLDLESCTTEFEMPLWQAAVVGAGSRIARRALRISSLGRVVGRRAVRSTTVTDSPVVHADRNNLVAAHVRNGAKEVSIRLSVPPVYIVTAIACASIAEKLLKPDRPVGAISPMALFESGECAAEAASLRPIS